MTSRSTTTTAVAKRPKCRIRGCSEPQRSKKRRLCSMHDQRFLATGKVGPARSVRESGREGERPSRRRAAIGHLRRLAVPFAASGFVASVLKAGIHKLSGGGRSLSVHTAILVSLERREWIAFGQPKGSYLRSGGITREGVRVLERET